MKKTIFRLLLTAVSVVFLGIFGSSILTNIHLKYLRILSTNTVLLHNSEGSGATGFLVRGKSGKKYIMTNEHVCGLEQKIGNTSGIFVIYKNQSFFLPIIKHYENNDLCAVEAPPTAGLPSMIAYSVSLGESAYAIGHPQLEPLSVSVGELSDYVDVTVTVGENVEPSKCQGKGYRLLSVNDGTLSSSALFFGTTNMCTRSMQANSSSIIISPGNSGSAIVNIFGQVIGVVSAHNQYGTRSYAVPLYDLRQFLEQL